jgi:hypothetical protein
MSENCGEKETRQENETHKLQEGRIMGTWKRTKIPRVAW